MKKYNGLTVLGLRGKQFRHGLHNTHFSNGLYAEVFLIKDIHNIKNVRVEIRNIGQVGYIKKYFPLGQYSPVSSGSDNL